MVILEDFSFYFEFNRINIYSIISNFDCLIEIYEPELELFFIDTSSLTSLGFQ